MKGRAGKLFHLLEKTFSEMAQYATEAELLQTSSNKPNRPMEKKSKPWHHYLISHGCSTLTANINKELKIENSSPVSGNPRKGKTLAKLPN